MRTFILACSLVLLAGCISVSVGTQKIDVYEQYPVYVVEPRPMLENLSGEDMDPHKKAALYAASVIKSGAVTKEEAATFAKMMEDAEIARKNALAKKLANDGALIIWGKKNQATVEVYNEYARDKNERLKIAEKSAK